MGERERGRGRGEEGEVNEEGGECIFCVKGLGQAYAIFHNDPREKLDQFFFHM